MKKLKKTMAVVLAVMVALTMGIATSSMVFAADPTGKVTVEDTHKGQVYKLYKIFDATTVEGRTADATDGISYTLMSGKTDLKATVDGTVVDGAKWFTVNAQGNVTIKDATAQAALTKDNAEFKAWAEKYGVQVGGDKEATADGAAVEFTGLADGYYFMTTTTGSLFSIDSIAPNVTIKDKNPPTEVDKSITGVGDGSVSSDGVNALAQVGTTVNYESRINIKEGAYNYKFTDTMTSGLTLDPDSVMVYLVDKDASVTDSASDVSADACKTKTAVNQTDDSKADITIEFKDTWLKANEGKDIVIQYSATVNENAVVADGANPNKAKIEYGNEDKPLTDEDEANVYSAKVKITKVDGNGAPLEGAGFVLKNSEGKYYKNTEGIVSWVDTEGEATEIFPVQSEIDNPVYDADEAAANPEYDVPQKIKGDAVADFRGLADGTYTLVEKTVPEGYNQAADTTLTIKPASTNNLTTELTVESTVTNNSGSELPSTGGIGTTIFYILGALLVIGCGIILIARRRMNNA